MGKIKTVFAAFAIASACLSFVLMALPTPTIGIIFIALSMFFSLCWWVLCSCVVVGYKQITSSEYKIIIRSLKNSLL